MSPEDELLQRRQVGRFQVPDAEPAGGAGILLAQQSPAPSPMAHSGIGGATALQYASGPPRSEPRPIAQEAPVEELEPGVPYPEFVLKSKNPRAKKMLELGYYGTKQFDQFAGDKRKKRKALKQYDKLAGELRHTNAALDDLHEILNLNPNNYYEKFDPQNPRNSVPNDAGRVILKKGEAKIAALKRLEQEMATMQQEMWKRGWLPEGQTELTDQEMDLIEEEDNKQYDRKLGGLFMESLLGQQLLGQQQ